MQSLIFFGDRPTGADVAANLLQSLDEAIKKDYDGLENARHKLNWVIDHINSSGKNRKQRINPIPKIMSGVDFNQVVYKESYGLSREISGLERWINSYRLSDSRVSKALADLTNAKDSMHYFSNQYEAYIRNITDQLELARERLIYNLEKMYCPDCQLPDDFLTGSDSSSATSIVDDKLFGFNLFHQVYLICCRVQNGLEDVRGQLSELQKISGIESETGLYRAGSNIDIFGSVNINMHDKTAELKVILPDGYTPQDFAISLYSQSCMIFSLGIPEVRKLDASERPHQNIFSYTFSGISVGKESKIGRNLELVVNPATQILNKPLYKPAAYNLTPLL